MAAADSEQCDIHKVLPLDNTSRFVPGTATGTERPGAEDQR